MITQPKGTPVIICAMVFLAGAASAQVGPTAHFIAEPLSGEAPLTVEFTDTSDPGDAPITAWEWDFDNNATIDSYEQHPSYEYTSDGLYSVSLSVTTDVGSDSLTYTGLILVGSVVYEHIYVDAVNGSNATGDGSQENPYKTITYAITVEDAIGTPDPWHIHVLPGAYDADPTKPAIDREFFPVILRSGMVLSGTDPELCIIDGIHMEDSAVPLIHGIDTRHITIENLTLQNMAPPKNLCTVFVVELEPTACLGGNMRRKLSTFPQLAAPLSIALVAVGMWVTFAVLAAKQLFL